MSHIIIVDGSNPVGERIRNLKLEFTSYGLMLSVPGERDMIAVSPDQWEQLTKLVELYHPVQLRPGKVAP